MRKKQYLFIMMAVVLLFPSFHVGANSTERVKAENADGKFTSKDEVVYATLDATGELEEIYVVNTLDVSKAGEVYDFGYYSNIKNLTDLSEIKQEGETIQINAQEGKFYYQGNLKNDHELPWDIAVSYRLDGEEINPEELAGQNGTLEISMKTTGNDSVDKVFFENYLLQISLQLPARFENLHVSGGMVANAGKNKQITFTVLPGEEKDFSVKADVDDFEFDGIEIAAIPSTLPIDTSDMDNMTDDMATLSNAIRDVHDGVGKLKDGVVDLNSGVALLKDGSTQYKDGISQLSGSSSEIVTASNSIHEALKTISTSLSAGSNNEMDLTQLAQLPAGLLQLAGGLAEAANGLTDLQQGYSQSFAALDEAISTIPSQQVSEAEIAELYGSGANTNVLDRLVGYYSAAQKIKGTYAATKTAFEMVGPTLSQTNTALNEMSGGLTSTANELTKSLEEMDVSALGELQKGLATLAANYGQFHSGLVGYTNGVNELSNTYSELHAGITGLSVGTGELANGVGELHDGTGELHEETKNLPEQMQEEINGMIQEYDKSDFEPVSFVSPNNEKVHSVQFVIKTESIVKEEQEAKQGKVEEKKGFWQRLFDLF